MILNYRTFLSDRWQLLQKLNFSRVWNYLKIISSFYLSVTLRKSIVWGGPFSINFETSSVCNLRCPECSTGTGKTIRNKKFTDSLFVAQKLGLHKKNAFWSNLYFQGEPFMNADLYSIIKQTSTHNLYSVVSTNGHFLDEQNCHKIVESGLNRIIVSLDGIDEESYVKYRTGGIFRRVIDGIRQLHKERERKNSSTPLIVVQFLVNKTNEHQIKKAPKFIKNLGADILEFKSMQIYSKPGLLAFRPDNKRFNRYAPVRREKVKNCFRLWSHLVYTSDGIVVPCCYDKTPDHAAGFFETFATEVWKSENFMEFRNRVLLSVDKPGICSNCNG